MATGLATDEPKAMTPAVRHLQLAEVPKGTIMGVQPSTGEWNCKTQMCWYHGTAEGCRKGDSCNFAHSLDEVLHAQAKVCLSMPMPEVSPLLDLQHEVLFSLQSFLSRSGMSHLQQGAGSKFIIQDIMHLSQQGFLLTIAKPLNTAHVRTASDLCGMQAIKKKIRR